MSDDQDEGMSTDDNDLPLSITHARDTIIFARRVEQDYNFFDYRFRGTTGDVVARMYLDTPALIAITAPLYPTLIPDDVMAYLRKRFATIQQFGGPDGYTELSF